MLYLRVLRHRDFRYLFLGQAASVTGDRVVAVALALFITQRTGSATDLGLVLGAQTLPLVALLLFGGVWADRLPRHRIMLWTDATRAVLHGVLAALILAGAVRIWQLVVIEAMFGAAQAFFQPAYTGLLPQTVPESMIQDAKALSETMANLAFLVGPALATVLVLGVGAGEAFALDSLTFVLSAAMLMKMNPRSRGEAAARASVAHELRAGWREVRSRTWVWATIAAFTVAVLTTFAQWYSLAPIIARQRYGSAGVFGLLEACAGVGAVLGAFVAMRWRPRRPLRVGMLMVLAWPVQCLAFALGAPLPLVVGFSVISGIGFSLLMIWWETALAQHIPPGALSRVSAWDWMGSLALLPVGYLLAGPLASVFGARTVLAVGSVIGLAALALALLSRSLRDLGAAPALPSEPGHSLVGVARSHEFELERSKLPAGV
jgi:MFS family permease